MSQSAKTVVDNMFAAFAVGDIDKVVDTVSNDTLWIYHGTQVIPQTRWEGKVGARKFFENILTNDVLHFEPTQYIIEGTTVVVLGNEHVKVRTSGQELKQKWVQVYTVENGLISRMEEFATTEIVNKDTISKSV